MALVGEFGSDGIERTPFGRPGFAPPFTLITPKDTDAEPSEPPPAARCPGCGRVGGDHDPKCPSAGEG